MSCRLELSFVGTAGSRSCDLPLSMLDILLLEIDFG